MADYSQDVPRKCSISGCEKIRMQDWADSRRYICSDHVDEMIVAKMQGLLHGPRSEFENLARNTAVALLRLEGKI